MAIQPWVVCFHSSISGKLAEARERMAEEYRRIGRKGLVVGVQRRAADVVPDVRHGVETREAAGGKPKPLDGQ